MEGMLRCTTSKPFWTALDHLKDTYEQIQIVPEHVSRSVVTMPDGCIPCLIGKSPQAPYTHNAKHALAVGDLVHIDTCGPFPTLTPKKEAFFTIFLNDTSNYGITTLLTTKNGAFPAWKNVESSWELASGNCIKAIHFDGAKEFTQALSQNTYSAVV